MTKVAAYQAPLLPSGSMEAIGLIRERVTWCETEGVEFLCCPEAVLGGLADYAARPTDFAISVENGQLSAALAPLASDRVATILGFTEISGSGELFNSAAVFYCGTIVGVYRKLHPAIRKSVYQAGDCVPVFTVGGLTFGIVICNDSNFVEPAKRVAAQGATVLFVPTNNALPAEKADVVDDARNIDIVRATETGLAVIRADVAGRTAGLVSYGSSSIIDPHGRVLQSGQRFIEDFLVADLAAAHVINRQVL